MRSRFTKGLPAVAVMSLAVVIMAGGVHWAQSSLSNPSGQERKKRNLKDQVLTLIDAAPDEVVDEKKAARTEKNKRFNKSKRASLLEEQQDGEMSGVFLESPPPPPLPVTSDLIVVGSIHKRQPYLSDNITVVYTEFTVHIEDILKNNSSAPVYAFEPLIVHREGGAIRMPSGRVFRYLVAPIGAMPEVGKRYVLFLQHEKEGDYEVVCGYELTDKTIIPLEDFADRAPLLDLNESQFLELLKQKISQTQAEKGM
jgi:hypothetical protein